MKPCIITINHHMSQYHPYQSSSTTMGFERTRPPPIHMLELISVPSIEFLIVVYHRRGAIMRQCKEGIWNSCWSNIIQLRPYLVRVSLGFWLVYWNFGLKASTSGCFQWIVISLFWLLQFVWVLVLGICHCVLVLAQSVVSMHFFLLAISSQFSLGTHLSHCLSLTYT